MALQAKLDDMRKQFESKAPPEALAIMHSATKALLQSNIVDRVLKVGDRAPDFSLSDHNGKEVRSSELLTKGPLVVSFYRGIW